MIGIGFRAHPQHVCFAVVLQDGGGYILRNVSEVVVSTALHTPEQLRFLRTTLLDVIAEYQATCAGIRTAEPVAQKPNILRLNIEGVIQELIASGAVATYFAGPIAKIAGLLRIEPRTRVKGLIDGSEDYPGIENWSKFKSEEREALLAALAALRIPRPRFVPLVLLAEYFDRLDIPLLAIAETEFFLRGEGCSFHLLITADPNVDNPLHDSVVS